MGEDAYLAREKEEASARETDTLIGMLHVACWDVARGARRLLGPGVVNWSLGFYARLTITTITMISMSRSYVAKTTEQLEHALGCMDAAGVELRAEEVVGEGSAGAAAFDREVDRVRAEVFVRAGVVEVDVVKDGRANVSTRVDVAAVDATVVGSA